MTKPNSFRDAIESLFGKKEEPQANAKPSETTEETADVSDEVKAFVSEITALKTALASVTETSQKQTEVLSALPTVISQLQAEIEALKKAPIEAPTVATATSNVEPNQAPADNDELDEETLKVMEVMSFVNAALKRQEN